MMNCDSGFCLHRVEMLVSEDHSNLEIDKTIIGNKIEELEIKL